ncbi:anti-sigma-I factor RsgI8-like [Penaeus monodon]|uniref:anti-sigma-I factor RsgI8-like n=1 Tax=Penaeus monodon TaxID=6687 RepID=UPI0018A740AC|nr:anti-sigma-I factor RsgI8-like [Penaeus monodon]
MKRWKDYCAELFGGEEHVQEEIERGEEEPLVLEAEIEAAIKKAEKGKAGGIDKVPAEALKEGGEIVIKVTKNIIDEIWRTGEWPKLWVMSELVPLPKVPGTQDCTKYQTVSLISHASKILLEILRQRLAHYLVLQIAEEQFSFTAGKGTTEAILVLRNIIQKVAKKQEPAQRAPGPPKVPGLNPLGGNPSSSGAPPKGGPLGKAAPKKAKNKPPFPGPLLGPPEKEDPFGPRVPKPPNPPIAGPLGPKSPLTVSHRTKKTLTDPSCPRVGALQPGEKHWETPAQISRKPEGKAKNFHPPFKAPFKRPPGKKLWPRKPPDPKGFKAEHYMCNSEFYSSSTLEARESITNKNLKL